VSYLDDEERERRQENVGIEAGSDNEEENPNQET
jgi:hypothetical protein